MLTKFQKTCEETVLQTLHELGLKQNERELTGLEETYIKFRASGTDVVIYIYEDEAGLESPNFSSTYEHWDYENPLDLIQAFDQQLRKILTKKLEKD